jgi:hypothetical protein
VQAMAEGQTIKHEVYGLGVVTASDGERTSVDFDDHGAKLFVTSIMTAELIGEAPATPPKTKRRRKASTAAKAAKKAAAAAAAAHSYALRKLKIPTPLSSMLRGVLLFGQRSTWQTAGNEPDRSVVAYRFASWNFSRVDSPVTGLQDP